MKILVTTNFSNSSFHALELAVQIAKHSDSSIHMLHVVNFPVLNNAEMDFEYSSSFSEAFQELLSENLEKMSKITLQYASVPITNRVLVGSVLDKILSYEEVENFDLLVLGSKPISNIRSYYFGTFTDRIIHKSSIPVLVVKEETALGDINKIILGHPFKRKERNIENKISQINSLFTGSIDLVRINTPGDFMGQDVFDKRADLIKQTPLLANCSCSTISYKDESEGLIYYASMTDADLIVIGDKHSSMLRRWIVGEDIAERVIGYSNLPVLIL